MSLSCCRILSTTLRLLLAVTVLTFLVFNDLDCFEGCCPGVLQSAFLLRFTLFLSWLAWGYGSLEGRHGGHMLFLVHRLKGSTMPLGP